MRLKKKLESDINELEIALDHANQANAEAQKNVKRYQDQIRELQQQVCILERSLSSSLLVFCLIKVIPRKTSFLPFFSRFCEKGYFLSG